MRKLIAAALAGGLAAGAASADILELTITGEAKGTVRIELLDEIAPKHVAQITTLVNEGAYDGVVFHRVIDGFMAQTGDVEHGVMGDSLNMRRAGTGGSKLADIPAEFSQTPHARGTVGMARSQSPDSANSQFFINFVDNDFLNGQYTVFGRVIEGMEVVDTIKRGHPRSGAVTGQPDYIEAAKIVAAPQEAQ